jgi:O-antigen/teichoic acid export membrane protein
MGEMVAVIAVLALPALPLAALLRFWRRGLRRWRVSLAAAALAPGIVLALCIALFASSAVASREQCGVDACGMAMMASMTVGFWAILALLIGFGLAEGLQRLLDRR